MLWLWISKWLKFSIIFSKDARNKVSLKLFHTFLAILFFNVYVTYLCNLNCKSNFHMLYGSCNFKLSLSRGYKEFWHKKTTGWKESMEWVISSNNNASKKHEITNLRKEIHNTLHNHVWFPKLSFQMYFIFGGPFKFKFQNVWKCSFVNVCVLI